uniref:J domain-containing protein n=1 Tax=Pyramimonas obovata TaxID=1411642 RepID=A0A7S0RGG1_9CHLO
MASLAANMKCITVGSSVARVPRRTALRARSAASLRGVRIASPIIRQAGVTSRRAQRLTVRANADAADPYAVLEVLPTTPSDRVMAAYNKLTRTAKADGDDAALAKYEAAYNSILMMDMKKRMSGQNLSQETSDLKYADKRNLIQEYAPWRPRYTLAEKKDLMINGIMFAVLWTWSIFHPDPRVSPMTLGTFAFFFRILFKLHKLFPSPENRENPEKAKQDQEKFVRAAGLCFGFLTVGVISVAFVPTFLAQITHTALPAWILTKQDLLINLVSTGLLTVCACFLR